MSEEAVPEEGEHPHSLDETIAEDTSQSEVGRSEEAAEILAR
jgi:hypothetical protein